MEGERIGVRDLNCICSVCLCDCTNAYAIGENINIVLCDISINKEDALPQQLCQQCLADLTRCCFFIDKYKKSEQTLSTGLNQKQSKLKIEKVSIKSEELKEEEIEINHFEIDNSQTSDPLCGNDDHSCNKTDLCPKPETNLERNLHTHERTHIKEKPYKTNESLIANDTWHTGETPFTCKFCRKTFATKASQISHEKKTQHAQKRHKCLLCEKAFAKKDDLVVHQRTYHTGERPFKCRFCEKDFAKRDNHVLHERTHTGERPFTCDECGNAFALLNTLKLHIMARHTLEKPFKCGFCEKSFLTKRQLAIHQRTHTGEKPYTCDHCGKRFPYRGGWKRHLEIHLEKSYTCCFCEKGFKRKKDQRAHEREHTRGISINLFEDVGVEEKV